MVKIGSIELAETELSRRKGLAVLNSSSTWASNEKELRDLYASAFTAAVTTRTAVVGLEDLKALQTTTKHEGSATFTSTYPEDIRLHTHSFLKDPLKTIEGGRLTIARGSINSYGYSPHPLSSYLSWIKSILDKDETSKKKPFIISVTGPPGVIEMTIVYIRHWAALDSRSIAIEINLSCPNIKGNDAPSGYDESSISEYVLAAQRANAADAGGSEPLTIGLKLPPYTYQAQFKGVINALSLAPSTPSTVFPHPIAFLTSTNTLGSSYWLNEGEEKSSELVKALPSSVNALTDGYDGTGGLAGESLHPISLGNVYKLANLLRTASDIRLQSISIIGVGGVMSGLSAQRMQAAGARAVGLATALGREGVGVFDRISYEITDEAFQDEDEDD